MLTSTALQAFIKALAAHFKKTAKIELPAWQSFVKTGTYKELPPYDADWYYVRAGTLSDAPCWANRSG